MYKYSIFLFLISLLNISVPGYSKTVEIEFFSHDIIFFDQAESDLMASDKKVKLDKFGLKVFFITDISKQLLSDGVKWTSPTGENINDIFHNLLNTFKYDDHIYYLKSHTESESSDSEDDSIDSQADFDDLDLDISELDF